MPAHLTHPLLFQTLASGCTHLNLWYARQITTFVIIMCHDGRLIQSQSLGANRILTFQPCGIPRLQDVLRRPLMRTCEATGSFWAARKKMLKTVATMKRALGKWRTNPTGQIKETLEQHQDVSSASPKVACQATQCSRA